MYITFTTLQGMEITVPLTDIFLIDRAKDPDKECYVIKYRHYDYGWAVDGDTFYIIYWKLKGMA